MSAALTPCTAAELDAVARVYRDSFFEAPCSDTNWQATRENWHRCFNLFERNLQTLGLAIVHKPPDS
jgi:hypothetical protein